MIFPHTIRGRLLLWFAGLFGLVLAGFGFTAFQLYRISGEQRIDEELERRVTLLQVDWRGSVPPGGGRAGRGGRGGRHPLPPPERRPGPEPFGPLDPSRPPPEGPLWPLEEALLAPEHVELRLSSETARLFPGEPNGFYYVGWTNRGDLLARSANAPKEVPAPDEDVTGRTYSRRRGEFREMYHVTVQGDCVLVGISTASLLAARQHFMGWLVAAGGVVLLIGLGGGWLIIRRSLRPVQQISEAATRIANGALSERVQIGDGRDELGGLAAVLNSTFARLEAAISDEKTFTSDASHELRTPLAVILTETQRARARDRTAAEYRETIEICHDTAQEMRKLVESLLELARLDAGQEPMARAPCDLGAVAAQALQLVQPLASEKQIKIATAFAAAPAEGDADRLRRVVVNLLQNAIRYNRDGGSIRLVTAADNTHAVLTVSDTGIGISAEDLPHIFRRFYRGDKARARSDGNSGLGLAICKSIIDAHHGSIDVQSTPGVGTTFSVRVPKG